MRSLRSCAATIVLGVAFGLVAPRCVLAEDCDALAAAVKAQAAAVEAARQKAAAERSKAEQAAAAAQAAAAQAAEAKARQQAAEKELQDARRKLEDAEKDPIDETPWSQDWRRMIIEREQERIKKELEDARGKVTRGELPLSEFNQLTVRLHREGAALNTMTEAELKKEQKTRPLRAAVAKAKAAAQRAQDEAGRLSATQADAEQAASNSTSAAEAAEGAQRRGEAQLQDLEERLNKCLADMATPTPTPTPTPAPAPSPPVTLVKPAFAIVINADLGEEAWKRLREALERIRYRPPTPIQVLSELAQIAAELATIESAKSAADWPIAAAVLAALDAPDSALARTFTRTGGADVLIEATLVNSDGRELQVPLCANVYPKDYPTDRRLEIAIYKPGSTELLRKITTDIPIDRDEDANYHVRDCKASQAYRRSKDYQKADRRGGSPAGGSAEMGSTEVGRAEPSRAGRRWLPYAIGGTAAVTVGAVVATSVGGDGQDDQRHSSPPATTATSTVPTAAELPGTYALTGTATQDDCGLGPTLARGGLRIDASGTTVTVHSSADLTGPYDAATGSFAATGTFTQAGATFQETLVAVFFKKAGQITLEGTLSFLNEKTGCKSNYAVVYTKQSN